MTNELTQALNEVTKAAAVLAAAQKVLSVARVEEFARKLEKHLKDGGHALYEARAVFDFEDKGLEKVRVQLEALQNTLAVEVLGAGERLKKLNALDPERWALKGKYKQDPSGYPTDKSVAYAIATWLFDSGFGRGSETAFAELDRADKGRFNTLREEAVKHCGDMGELGFKFWEEGRHDT